jgi:hypothetical protein
MLSTHELDEICSTNICGLCNSELIRRPDLDLPDQKAYACFDGGHVHYGEKINAMWVNSHLISVEECVILEPVF